LGRRLTSGAVVASILGSKGVSGQGEAQGAVRKREQSRGGQERQEKGMTVPGEIKPLNQYRNTAADARKATRRFLSLVDSSERW